MRKSKNDYFGYVCPRCFSQLQDCECPRFPQTLLQIDRGIQRVVRTLNRKGYVTTGCCEGHYNEGGYSATYICFLEDYSALHASPLPDGFTFDKGKFGVIYVYPRGESEERFTARHVSRLIALHQWADNLPENMDAEQ